MGINLSKKEKPAFQYFDQVLDRLIQQSEEVNLDKKNLQKKIFRSRKIREFEPGDIICEEGQTGPAFMLLSGKLKIGDVFKFRRNDIICAERLFGLGSFFEISAEETSEIWQLTRTNLAQVGVEFHLLLRYCPIFPLKLDFENIPELLEEVDEDKNWWKISIMAGYLDRALGLSTLAFQLIGENIDFQSEIELVLSLLSKEYKNEIPKFLKVAAGRPEVLLGKTGQDRNWFIAFGSVREKTVKATVSDVVIDLENEDDVENVKNEESQNTIIDLLDRDDGITDDKNEGLFDDEVISLKPLKSDFWVQPGSVIFSVGRRTMITLYFMKFFRLPSEEAIEATEKASLRILETGQKISEKFWFKIIILSGELQLVMQESEEKADYIENTENQEKSENIEERDPEEIFENEPLPKFDKCLEKESVDDEFIALEKTVLIISLEETRNTAEAAPL